MHHCLKSEQNVPLLANMCAVQSLLFSTHYFFTDDPLIIHTYHILCLTTSAYQYIYALSIASVYLFVYYVVIIPL